MAALVLAAAVVVSRRPGPEVPARAAGAAPAARPDGSGPAPVAPPGASDDARVAARDRTGVAVADAPPAAVTVAGPTAREDAATQERGRAAGEASPTDPPERGDEVMSRAMGLRHPASTPLLDTLRTTPPEELELRGRLARMTRKPAPAGLDELFALRRAGVSKAELRAFCDREFFADPSVRGAVQEWIRSLQGQ